MVSASMCLGAACTNGMWALLDGGRGALNSSEWDRPQDVGAGDVVEAVRGGSMPPWYYTLLHANASPDAADKNALIRGLEATFAASPPKGGGGG